METPSPALARRTLRTYARREDAEQAQSALADHAIAAEVAEHFFTPPGSGKRISGGCSLTVAVAEAAAAARVLLKLPPSETAGTPQAAQEPPARSPLRRRIGPRTRQKSTLPIILIAIACSSLGLYWLVQQAMRGKVAPAPSAGENPENILVREDLNWDGAADVVREYTPGGALLSMLEDRDFDGAMDLRWIWQRGQLIYRDRDIDRDGTMDERTTFDGFNEPFYVDLRRGGKGPVVRRRVYREGVLWKLLEDRDADTHFDWLQEFTPEGVLFRDEALPQGSPENGVPQPQALPQGAPRAAALPLAPAPRR